MEHQQLQSMSLPELAERLEDLDHRRTPVGWTPEDAAIRASIERCIVELVSTHGSGAAIACDYDIRLRSKEVNASAVVREVKPGGLVIAAEGTWIPGTHVEMQIRQDASDEHGLRARGIVSSADKGKGVVIVSVSEQPSEAHERRLHRFLLELVRHRVHN
jgi:hypothetical protein